MFKREIDKIYENALVKYDKEIDKLDSLKNRKCVCYKGCSHCCHQLIIITDFEKEVLRYAISTLFRKDRDKLLKKTREQTEAMLQNSIINDIITPSLTENEQQAIQRKFFELNLECPFLKDNACMIHKLRPISCLTYRNYGNPNECKETINVSEAYTFNNIEIDLRREIFEKTAIFPNGINILQFAILEILDS